MNIKYHALVGIVGEAVAYLAHVPAHGAFFVASIAPDFPLLANEIRMLIKREAFDPWKVPTPIFNAYHVTHSLFVSALLMWLLPAAGFGHLIHAITDWFTHTGRFASKPFYPVSNYTIKFGREILK